MSGRDNSDGVAVVVPIADIVQIFSVGSAVNIGVYASHSANDNKPWSLSPSSPPGDRSEDEEGDDDTGDDGDVSGLFARSPTGAAGMRCRCFSLRCRDTIQVWM